MANIEAVLRTVIKMFDTRLYFNPFSFTIWQYFLSLLILSIVIYFVVRVLRG